MTNEPRPLDAVAWLSLPLKVDALADVATALDRAYGHGLHARPTAGGTGMWLIRPPVEDQAQAAVIRSAHEDWSDT